MITGFNTDVKHGNKVYHVQTEDKGRNNPKIETLVYVGGEILDNHRSSYERKKEDLSEEEIMEMLEGQHKRVIRSIKIGKYDEPISFPEGVITERSLDDVISEYLETEEAPDFLKLITNGVSGLQKGKPGLLSFETKKVNSLEPISGAMVRVKLLHSANKVKVLFNGETDRSGNLSGEITLPVVDGGECFLMVQAISEWGAVEQKYPLRRV